jgi:hypothetical protein
MVADMSYNVDIKLFHAETRRHGGTMLLRASASPRDHKDLFWVA